MPLPLAIILFYVSYNLYARAIPPIHSKKSFSIAEKKYDIWSGVSALSIFFNLLLKHSIYA